VAAEKNKNLEEYNRKRDFRRTREPEGKPGKSSGKPIFIIQKHDASNLHYDFRIEVEGVLKSWAVPKGLSTDPKEKRLALPTEDHPMGYADFEGVIPEDEYGGGTVMVWDRGAYESIKETPITEALEDGHVEIHLAGEKLQGGYALIRTPRGGKEQWLIIKMKDDYADARRNPVSTEPDSVVTGRSLEEIREEENEREKDDEGE
jgi:DNA ligase D-like protein (predicted 3'-phosphoesterase)